MKTDEKISLNYISYFFLILQLVQIFVNEDDEMLIIGIQICIAIILKGFSDLAMA